MKIGRWKVVVLGCLCGSVGLGAGLAFSRAFLPSDSHPQEIRLSCGDATSAQAAYGGRHSAVAGLASVLSEDEGILVPEDWLRDFLGKPDWSVSVAELSDFITYQDIREEVLRQLSRSVERARKSGAGIPAHLEDYTMLVYDEGEQYEKPLVLGPWDRGAFFITKFYLATLDRMVLCGGGLMRPVAFRRYKGFGGG